MVGWEWELGMWERKLESKKRCTPYTYILHHLLRKGWWTFLGSPQQDNPRCSFIQHFAYLCLKTFFHLFFFRESFLYNRQSQGNQFLSSS